MIIYERIVRIKLQWKSHFAGLIGERTLRGFDKEISMNKIPIPMPRMVA